MNPLFKINSLRAKPTRVLSIVLTAVFCLSLIAIPGHSEQRQVPAVGQGKLEAALEYLDDSKLRPSETVGVIVQFTDDAIPGDTAEVKNQKKLTRRNTIVAAGGQAGKDYNNFPAHSAKLSLKALKQLEKDSRVKRISVDHNVKGALATAAKAIGADQVWTGFSDMPAFSGNGVTVVVLDSGVDNRGDLVGRDPPDHLHCRKSQPHG